MILHRFFIDFGCQNGVRNRLKNCFKISTQIHLKFNKKLVESRLAQIFAKESQHPRNTVKTNTKSTFSKNTQSKKIAIMHTKTRLKTTAKPRKNTPKINKK